MKRASAILGLICLMMTSCGDDETGIGADFEGTTWRLYEKGYSPGAGYITEPVAAEPPQLLRLGRGRMMYTNIGNLSGYTHYRILDDLDHNTKVLAFFKYDPGNEGLSVDHLEHSYIIEETEGTMKLWFRYCIEGCHLGFVRERGEGEE
jgi:hypothetical protein